MSPEINPFESEPVYERDQVLTTDDLKQLWIAYYQSEVDALNDKDEETAYGCCISHKTIEAVYMWLKEGKPALFEEEYRDPSDD